jgi:hypothetical protein
MCFPIWIPMCHTFIKEHAHMPPIIHLPSNNFESNELLDDQIEEIENIQPNDTCSNCIFSSRLHYTWQGQIVNSILNCISKNSDHNAHEKDKLKI